MSGRPAPPVVEVDSQPPPERLAADRWRCAWRVRNAGPAGLAIGAAWLPHGRFRAERADYTPPIVVAPGETVHLDFEVSCLEEAGTVVENCFVILTIEAQGWAWRVFARLAVSFGEDGAPNPRTELITVNPVGFASDTMAPGEQA